MIQSIVDRLRLQQHRQSTRSNYYSIWRQFNEFFIKLDSKPATWEERLILFVGYLIDKDLKSTTIKCYISAIKAVLKEDGECLDEDTYLLKSLTRACKLKNDKVRTRLPIRKHLLMLLIGELPQVLGNQPFLITLYTTILVTMYFGLFRISEVLEGEHVLKAKDVQIGWNKNKMLFILRSSKTHTQGCKPQTIKINSTEFNEIGQEKTLHPTAGMFELCPFKVLKDYLQVRKKRSHDSEQFFVFADRSLVMAAHIRAMLHKLLSSCNLDSSNYGTHSLRAGRLIDLYHMGVKIEVIAKLGRWKSGAIYTYLKP